MAIDVTLGDLVGAVTRAISDAQGHVERHYLDIIGKYFDASGRPLRFDIKLPDNSSTSKPGAYQQLGVPLLSLVECRPMTIREMEMDLTVQLDGLIDSDKGGEQPGTGQIRSGAQIDVARANFAADAPDSAANPYPLPLEPPDPLEQHSKLIIGLGITKDSQAPAAHLKIKVKAHEPTEGMVRLLTQLNKTF